MSKNLCHKVYVKLISHFRSHIPVSRRSLIRKLLLKIPEYEHEKMLTLFSHIDASIQNNSRPYTLRLKDLYDPLNPDKGNFELECSRSFVKNHCFTRLFRHGKNQK